MDIKMVGRIVTRAAGTDPANNDGAIIGAMFKDGIGILKPNTVYTIVSIDGELMLREEGECAGTSGPLNGYMFHWGSTLEYIMSCFPFILTLKEYRDMCKK